MKNIKKLAVIVFILAVIAAIIFPHLGCGERRAENAEDVGEYLISCGLEAVFLSEKDITIPAEFSEVYTRYNDLQRENGFNLLPHRGHAAKLYTFTLPDLSEAHIIVCCGEIVGGDISTAALGGEMRGLGNGQ